MAQQGQSPGQARRFSQCVRKRSSAHQAHGVVKDSVWPAPSVENRNDRWVIKSGSDERLTLYASLNAIGSPDFCGDALQRYLPPQPSILRR
jgi:hypothetical protein